MKSKINSIKNRPLKNFSQADIFSKNIKNNDFKNKISKITYYRNDLSDGNYTFWKAYSNMNENTNTKNYINSNNFNINSNTIIDTINLKEKFKPKTLKRSINSASLIRKTNKDNPPNLLLNNNNNCNNNNYNIRKIHDIITLIGKKLDSLHNINKDENEKYFNYNNKYKNTGRNDSGLISSNNHLSDRNNIRKKKIIFSKTIYNFKNQSSLFSYKENININNIDNNNKRNNINIICEKRQKLNKIELIPYPYKRLQKKLRKYFSFPKKIDLSEEHFPSNFVYKQVKLNKKYRNSCYYNNNNEKIKINCEEKKNYDNKINENIKKEDKSINTDNSIFGKNFNNLKFNKIKIQNGNIPLFNNELISSRTYRKDIKDIKLFITTSNNKNRKGLNGENRNKKAIFVYQKNN